MLWPSCRCVAGRGHRNFPPSVTFPCIENAEDTFDISWMHFFIRFVWPGIPLKPNLWSFSKLNPWPSNCCYKWTILVHLLAFWLSFLQVVRQRKVSALICRWQLVPMLYWGQHGKQSPGFQLWHHLFPAQLASASKNYHMEGSWALEWQSMSPGALC